MDKKQVKNLREKAEEEIGKADTLEELDHIYKKYLAQKKGKLTQVLRSLGDLPKEKRAELGQQANQTKDFIVEEIDRRKESLEEEKGFDVDLDVTAPGEKVELGRLHPLTQIKRRARSIFKQLGFSVVEGPEVETEWYNFDALNIPEDHPARDMWDTFWIKQESGKEQGRLLLRTHTSPVQIRYMEQHNPPLRIIVPGRCFRHEKPDSSHDIQFDQIEGLMVAEEVSAAHFKAVIRKFLDRFFKKEVESRIRPSYFPFTEPSFEVDVKVEDQWVETLGAGMVHPKVFNAAGYNPKRWKGYAFGIGVDRLAMMKYEIDDIRLFYENDLRFLKQF